MEIRTTTVKLPPNPDIGRDQVDLHYFSGAEVDISEVLAGKEYPISKLRFQTVGTIVDIGAHVGSASLFLRSNFPHAKIYSFEPTPITFELLQRNMGWDQKTQLFPFGLSDHDSQETMFHSEWLGLGASSVVKTKDHEGAQSDI